LGLNGNGGVAAQRAPASLAAEHCELDLGPLQQIYYAKFDGQRRKSVLIKVIGE
jgi:thiamine phosphate synthase YjbQ (UPF0047 family)